MRPMRLNVGWKTVASGKKDGKRTQPCSDNGSVSTTALLGGSFRAGTGDAASLEVPACHVVRAEACARGRERATGEPRFCNRRPTVLHVKELLERTEGGRAGKRGSSGAELNMAAEELGAAQPPDGGLLSHVYFTSGSSGAPKG